MTQRIAIVLTALCLTLGASAAAFAAPRPVVVELFTSHGCSSCPPADALLRKLAAGSSFDDIRIIALSEHVDYWDDLGWPDRFASARFTRRQQQYARHVFGSNRVYTPQMVIDGQREMVGSRAGEVRSAIRASADQASLPVALRARPAGGKAIDVSVRVDATGLDNRATVWLALTQNNAVSNIGGGENAGRRLIEDGVVRVWRRAANVPANADTPSRYQARLPVPDNTSLADLNVVAFVQRRDTLAIVGAAHQALAQTDRQAAR